MPLYMSKVHVLNHMNINFTLYGTFKIGGFRGPEYKVNVFFLFVFYSFPYFIGILFAFIW